MKLIQVFKILKKKKKINNEKNNACIKNKGGFKYNPRNFERNREKEIFPCMVYRAYECYCFMNLKFYKCIGTMNLKVIFALMLPFNDFYIDK